MPYLNLFYFKRNGVVRLPKMLLLTGEKWHLGPGTSPPPPESESGTQIAFVCIAIAIWPRPYFLYTYLSSLAEAKKYRVLSLPLEQDVLRL